ncbi:ABC transporter substrate-binding protein [Bordetella sp. N]|uniref:ABC transporter substrate-binding protein n=1 Tax=Bordetella sp. N TaxID=1746199 RepID=UPI00070DC28D|nr:ABC transporter substrate-binding protein [Bordetella sp. N]ALM82121.1 ABC transporter substrate-binding protein [Bordetella sp. N]
MKPHARTLLLAALLAASASASAQNLRIGFADPVSSADPQLNNHAGDRSLALQIYDSIVDRRDSGDYPMLAQSWKRLDDKTWEFKLNPNIKWQDGQPFTADDLVFSFERARKVPGSVASYSGRLRTVEQAIAKDPHTLIVKTNIPAPGLLMDIGAIYVVSRHAGASAATEDYNSAKAAIGTGPYKLVSYQPGDRSELVRNDLYWGPKPEWAKVDYRYINNGAARTAALLAGDVDVIDKVSPSDLAKLKQSPNVSIYAYPGLRNLLIQPSFRPGPNEFITDNAGKPLAQNPLTDVRVRRALSLAINRKAIVDRIMQGTVTESNQDMPPKTIGYNTDIKDIPYDPAAAKKLLAEAGFPEGFKLTVHVPNDRYPLAPETLQAVAQFWTRIGVKTNVEAVPWSIYSGRANKNDYAVSVLAWGNGTGELGYALVNVFATVNPAKGLGNSNWGHYSNADLDQALVASSEEFDDAKRAEILRHAARILSDDVGVIPLYHYQNIWATRKGLKVEPYVSDRTSAQMVTRVQP